MLIDEPTFSRCCHTNTAIANPNPNPLQFGYNDPWLRRPLAVAGRHPMVYVSSHT